MMKMILSYTLKLLCRLQLRLLSDANNNAFSSFLVFVYLPVVHALPGDGEMADWCSQSLFCSFSLMRIILDLWNFSGDTKFNF